MPAAQAATVKPAYTEVYHGVLVSPGGATTGDNDEAALYNLGRTIGFNSDDSDVSGPAAGTNVLIALFETSIKAGVVGDGVGAADAVEGTRYGDDSYLPDKLEAISSNDDILVSWSVSPVDGDVVACNDAELIPDITPRGVLIGGSFAASDTIYNAAGLSDEDIAAQARRYVDLDGETPTLDRDGAGGADTAAMYRLCFTAAADDTAATSTVTIKADGTVVATLKITAVGPADSIALSLEGTKIAGDNGGVDDFVTIKVKDENGTVINGDLDSVSSVDVDDIVGMDGDGVMDWDGNPENGNDDIVGLLQATDAVIAADDADGDEFYNFDLASDVCVADEDAEMTNQTFTVRVEDDAQEILSNAVTFTCGVSGEDARVTKVTPEATSGGKVYEEAGALDDGFLSLTATVVGGDGKILGAGSNVFCDDFDWSVDAGDYAIGVDTTGFTDEVVDGECELGQILPGDENGDFDIADNDDTLSRFGKFTYVVTADVPDLGDLTADALDFTLSYLATGTIDSVTLSKVRNAAKTIATITFDGGEEAAYLPVYFQVEKANGNVQEYRRRANGDGVATLVLARRNQVVYIYAYAGEDGDESDTIRVRFR